MPDICVGVEAWDPQKTYATSISVVYDDKVYVNLGWTAAGVSPATHPGIWHLRGSCSSTGGPNTSTATPTTTTTTTTTSTPDTKVLPPCTSSTPEVTEPPVGTHPPAGTFPVNEVRPTGPTGPDGECVWPVWNQNRTYASSSFVGQGQAVFQNAWFADPGVDPSHGEPWRQVATCLGAPPRTQYTVEEMKAMLNPNIRGFQVVYDPWTPLRPTQAEMAQDEAEHRSTPSAKAIIKVNRMLPVREVEKVVPGRLDNPANVRRVEAIMPVGLFNKFFPVRHVAYSYVNFLKAVALFPAYCDTYTDGRDSEAICKRILATSFAHWVQETGANHGSLFYRDAGHSYNTDNINPDADAFYSKGQRVDLVNQGLWFLREVGHHEPGGNDAYRDCELIPDNMMFQLAYPCADGVGYFGRGSKQLSWNYNYGPFSQEVYGDALVLLNEPGAVADTWLNFASGIWFSVTPQSPKPPMLWVIDGTWVPNGADLAAGRTPGFGATTLIINGGLECGIGISHAGPAQRAFAYRYFMGEFNLPIDPNEDLLCTNAREFDQSSSAATQAYYTINWREPICDVTASQTPWQIHRVGDYARCVMFFFRSHWFLDGVHVSDYGRLPGLEWGH